MPSSLSDQAPSCLSTQRYTDGYFTNARRQKLFYCAVFPPTSESLRGVILLLHGIGEHSLRYAHVYNHLCGNNYGVIAYDMVSHGQSECEEPGLRAHASKYQFFVDDTNEFVTVAKLAVYSKMMLNGGRPDPRLIIMGISFGGVVALSTILAGKHHFDGCIAAAPAISVEFTLTLRIIDMIIKPLLRLFPAARLVAGVNMSKLSRDSEFTKDYMMDPLVMTDKLTVLMAVQTRLGSIQLQRNKEVEDPTSTFCKVPLLILQGTEDKVTSVASVETFMRRAANQDKELKLFPELFHCLFNEPEKQQVMEYATKWLNKRFDQSEAVSDAVSTSLMVSKH